MISWRHKPMVLYAAGPGDVIGTFEAWCAGAYDPTEVAVTYSGQFFSAIREMNWEAHVIAHHPSRGIVRRHGITVEHRPKSSSGTHGLSYHFRELRYWLGIVGSAWTVKASHAVISGMDHWWLLTLLRLTGVRVIPTLHCTLWPYSARPTRRGQRLLQCLNGWFWRHVPYATICVSPECERQVRELAGESATGLFLHSRAQYRTGYLDSIPPAVWSERPFRLLFAGRMERSKGIFDLLDVASQLRDRVSGGVLIEVCGSGGAREEFQAEIESRRLADIITYRGQLDHQEMKAAYGCAHAIVVPTTASFPEGLNKVVVEGVLAGRPVIATDVCNARDVLPNAVIHVRAGDISSLANAISRLASERSFYLAHTAACKVESTPFYDANQSWGAAVRKAISTGQNGT
jgi:glycogen(starch) synthase